MATTYDYVITLRKTTSPKLVDWVCNLLLFIALIAFVYGLTLSLSGHFIKKSIPIIVCIYVMLMVWALILFRKKTQYYKLALAFAGIGWFLFPIHKIIIGVAYIVVAILEKQVRFPAEIGIDNNGVIINSLPKKMYVWNDISNILIKDGILTIDFKSNKLLQREIQDTVSRTDEIEFNSYCKERLAASK